MMGSLGVLRWCCGVELAYTPYGAAPHRVGTRFVVLFQEQMCRGLVAVAACGAL
jgi:hypothetical protein